jgi:hypothetical protein
MKKIILSTITASMLLTGAVYADTEVSNKVSVKEANVAASNSAKKDAKSGQAKLAKEALKSLELTVQALKDLEDNNSDAARKNIELALGKLEVILSAEDAPKLLPVDNQIKVYNFLGSAEDVTKAVKTVKALLSVNKIQEARELLSTLQSEMDVVVVNLPLATYPDALKLASKHILEEKTKEAKEILKLALSTFTEVHQIIPLPMIKVNYLVALASDVAKEDKELALKYLKGASAELDKSETLGYISESSTTYNELHKLIEGVEKEIKGPNKAEKLFKNLSEKIKEFKEKIFSEKENKNSSK